MLQKKSNDSDKIWPRTNISRNNISKDHRDQLAHFIKRMVSDDRLKPVHISLSVALCHSWISNNFQCSYRVSRSVLMSASRIRSRATYHKALKELQIYGYVKYLPSYHPLKGSEIMVIEEQKNNSDEHESTNIH